MHAAVVESCCAKNWKKILFNGLEKFFFFLPNTPVTFQAAQQLSNHFLRKNSNGTPTNSKYLFKDAEKRKSRLFSRIQTSDLLMKRLEINPCALTTVERIILVAQ